MISDNYQDETAENLTDLGYVAGFMEDLSGGEEIAIMHKDFTDGEKDVVEFYTVLQGTVRKIPYHHSEGNGCLVRFVVRTERGATKPMSYGGSWGLFVRSVS